MSKATPASELITAIDKLLAGMSGGALSTITQGSGPDNLYEVWLWSLIVREAESISSVSVELKHLKAGTLLFRKAPGALRTPGYSYAVLARDAAPRLEAHVGAYVEGKSGVRHEADVLVVPVIVAEACRASSHGIPWPDKLVMVLEAKFSASARALWLGHGRGLLGLGQEVWPNHLLALVSNRPSTNVMTLLGDRFFPCTWPGTSAALETKLSAKLESAV